MTTLAAVIGQDVLANRPAAGVTGRLFAATDTTPPTVYRDNGASWDTYATAGGGTVTTSRGDLIVRGASADQRLAVGAANRLLRSDGTDPSWGQVVPADLDLSTDVTTANATSGHHGLLPKGSGVTTEYLDGTLAWSTPAGGGGGSGMTNPMTTAGDMIYEGGGVDRARGVVPSMSAGYRDYIGPPANVTDGNDATWTASGADAPGLSDYTLDLGAAYTIAGFRVLLPGSAYVPGEYRLQSADSGSGPWTDRSIQTAPPTDTGVTALGAPVSARYWRLHQTVATPWLGFGVMTWSLLDAVVPSRLAVGANGSVLAVQGGVPSWVNRTAAHVANGSTVDQLRDALIAAGLMAAS